jgi:hypothetical protein
MGAVTEYVSERLAIGEDGREVQKTSRLRRGALLLHQKARDNHRNGTEASHEEGGPPPPFVSDDLRHQEREADTN